MSAHKGLYEGMLLKKPTSLSAYLSWGRWRPRYLVADDEMLRYYSSAAAAKRGPNACRGTIDFSRDGCVVEFKGRLDAEQSASLGNLFGFDVICANSRVLSFASSSAKDARYWANVLKLKCQRASLRKKNPERWKVNVNLSSGSSNGSPRGGADHSVSEVDESSRDEADSLIPLFGDCPAFFMEKYEKEMSPEAVASYYGWCLDRCEGGVRIFEREVEYAGNSATDVNASISEMIGPLEMRSQAIIERDVLQVFTMMMDLSISRREWDPLFREASVDSIGDEHSDIVTITYSGGRRFVSSRQFEMNRYWCREDSGAYLICMYPKDGSKQPKGAELAHLFVTIIPEAPGVSSFVTITTRLSPGGWMQYCRPLAREFSFGIHSCIASLRSLARPTPRIRSEDEISPDDEVLKFECDLQRVVTEFDNLTNIYGLVSALRRAVSSLKKLSSEELALQKARKLLEKNEKSKKEKRKATLRVLEENPAEEEIKGDEEEIETDGDGLNYNYGMPRNNYILPMALSKDGVSAWWDSGIEKGFWKVRGPNYLNDRIKVPSEVSAMELLQIQWSFFDEPKRNIALAPGELVQLQHEGRSDRPFLFVINFMVPTIGNYVMYCAKRKAVDYPRFNKMLEDFMNGDDAYRNSRFKIIPNVVAGSYLAKRGIGSTPAIIGKKIKTEYFKGDNWMEVCIDVGSSKLAGSLMSLVKTYASNLVIDLAFLFESQTPEELPEVVLSGSRMHMPLMYPTDELVRKYTKSQRQYEEALLFPEELKKSQIKQIVSQKEPNGSATPRNGAETKITARDDDEHGEEETKNGANVNRARDEDLEEVNAVGENYPFLGPYAGDLNYNYAIPHDNNYLVNIEKSKYQLSAYSDSASEGGYHEVRGSNYLQDGIKIPAYPSAMELVACQWSFYSKPRTHISAHPDELIQKEHAGRRDRPFLVVINFAVPLGSGEGVNMVAYFAERRGVKDEKFDRMLCNFIHGNDTQRNQRFKIIPSVVEGNFVARRAIESKPAILGRKIKTNYYRGPNCFEICVDVGSSKMAERLMGLVKTHAESMVLDLAFLLESQSNDELPERILGATRFHRPLMFPLAPEVFKERYVSDETRN